MHVARGTARKTTHARTIRTPLVVPQAMAALGEERAFLVDTTQRLDTSLEERERLLAEVAEAKVKVIRNNTTDGQGATAVKRYCHSSTGISYTMQQHRRSECTKLQRGWKQQKNGSVLGYNS